jgi:transposase
MKKEAAISSSTENSREKSSTQEQEILLPTTIFHDRTLSFLEAIVEYLKKQRNLSYHEIAVLTNRDERNIWTLHHRAEKKKTQSEQAPSKEPVMQIPLSVVKDRSVSILEVVVEHLRDKTGLSNHKIATMLKRSDKTISTVYIRTKKKRTELAKAI